MNCYYCDRILLRDTAYEAMPAAFDLGSAAPRCPRHWRFPCAQCRRPAHFMAVAYCTQTRRLFCRDCAAGAEEVAEPFWYWGYFLRLRSPWSQQWHPALDRLEFEGLHPYQRADEPTLRRVVSDETHLVRYPMRPVQWRTDAIPDDAAIRQSWNNNAQRWTDRYDDDGDSTRRYQTDPPMLDMLGDVRGLRVLDAGAGNGYLSRKLARAGAHVTAVEFADQLLARATQAEALDALGITYHNASITDLSFLGDDSFDRVVCNFVLMDVRDYDDALREIGRVLRPGGICVAVISHPAFACGPGSWYSPAPDSPRPEDRCAFMVDQYFRRGAYVGVWGNLDQVISFHRPLCDYWNSFRTAGFVVSGFDEPSLTERGRRELPPSQVAKAQRIAYACVFRLLKPQL